MDDYTKRFLRDLILSGVPFGTFWAIYASLDYGWNTGIIMGAIMGLAFGLFVAYINAREFSKPTYPLVLPRREIFSEPIRSEFRLQSFLSPNNFILVALALLVLLAKLVSATNSDRLLQFVLALFVVALAVLWEVLRITFTQITIDSNGFEFVSMLYKLKVAWEDVVQVERRGHNWFIICRSSHLTTIPFFDSCLRYIEIDKIISLRGFSSDFLKSELSDSILHYGKNIIFASAQ